jgi:hypothetical protein
MYMCVRARVLCDRPPHSMPPMLTVPLIMKLLPAGVGARRGATAG